MKHQGSNIFRIPGLFEIDNRNTVVLHVVPDAEVLELGDFHVGSWCAPQIKILQLSQIGQW